MASALPAIILWVVLNHGALQVSSFNLGNIPGIGGNSIPGLSNVGNMLGIGKCDLHLGNIFKCNQQVKNFNGANPPQSSPSASSPSTTPADQALAPAPAPGSSFYASSPQSAADSPVESPAESPPGISHVSPSPSPDGEAAADLTMDDESSIDPSTSLVADKASDPSNPNECCKAVLHVHLTCLCSFLSLKMVMALQLAEGYLTKVASMCHIDFKGC